MKHLYLVFAVAFSVVFSTGAYAQTLQLNTINNNRNLIKCYTVENIAEYRKTHPNAETDAQFEAWINHKIQARKAQRVASVNYTIPIIFHIISDGEAVGTYPNLSAASIRQQMLQLNKDYANQSNSPYAVAANTGIQFVLAQKNEAGVILAEPGIDRLSVKIKNWKSYDSGWLNTYIDATIKPASIWNPNNYFNVWVVPSFTNGQSDLLGYATFPTGSTLTGLGGGEDASTAGVVLQTGAVGSAFAPFNCGASYGLGKTLSHEAGHFFGLRHIWGDSTCGNDFCDDTPIHFTSNSGVPTHPKPNSCGTADEMFENYMDYTDDIVLNTFTANQADRMQTVMLNSPRRQSLANLVAGGVPVAPSNKIAFSDCTGSISISEAGTTGTYPRYKDLNLTLNVEDKATGAATVTLLPTGTAINNFHYQLLTPLTLTFAAGDNYKSIKVRIFDNAEADGDRAILLNYTISGTGVTAGATGQSMAIYIKDDDNVKIGSSPVALLNETFDTPGAWLAGSFISPAGPNIWKIGNNGGAGVSGPAFYITNNSVTKPLAYTNTVASDAVAVSPLVSSKGFTSTTLNFNYKSNGELADANSNNDFGSLMYTYDNHRFGGLTDASGTYKIYQGDSTLKNSGVIILPTNFNDTTFGIGFRWINDDNTGNNPPFLIDDVQIKGIPYTVETTVSTSYGFDVRTNANVNVFRSTTNNKVIANISTASTDLTGVVAQITQPGAGSTALSTVGGAYLRSQKVFAITQGTASINKPYTATLYFTEDEMTGWAANKLTLKMLQLKQGISLANGIIDTSTAQLVTPTVVENSVAGYITYTGTFTGAQQILLVSANTTLTKPLIDFTVKGFQQNIVLSFATLSENNNKGFAVYRSLDSTNFTQIGFVNGAGTIATPSNYSYTDNYVQPNKRYYYQLRQISNDSSFILSPIHGAIVLSTATGIEIAVNPNPASNFVNVFIRGTANIATIQLINSAGQKLKQTNSVNAYGGVYNLPVWAIAKGIYTLRIILPEGTFTKTILIN